MNQANLDHCLGLDAHENGHVSSVSCVGYASSSTAGLASPLLTIGFAPKRVSLCVRLITPHHITHFMSYENIMSIKFCSRDTKPQMCQQSLLLDHYINQTQTTPLVGYKLDSAVHRLLRTLLKPHLIRFTPRQQIDNSIWYAPPPI